ncbi:toxin-antitoxin system HicB family antitoxin [Kitasatospora kifunensis]|uniref:Antitoxin component of RelBE/YafQ-DinJ toxin-antitoxin module n=1 Tax=Kitasatospora kifunensis TaxID=58351 RepID=A0A7W7R0M9_KITKI|nr:toxin-antitoxin system HicB family antitoxin [Kitasatospora kifunensis]MBB4923257.1 antitoxin component of RelBE/YafQ-DinJ toxin-antitoxin module [Kitasatospora kifunensis]
MGKKQLNVRVDATTAEMARERAEQQGISMNQYIERLVQQDMGEAGLTFVDAAAQFMKEFENEFLAEFGERSAADERQGGRR